MAVIKDPDSEKHLDEDSVETPAEEGAESYAGHMPDGEDDDVEDMLDQTGIYQEADDLDTDAPEVNIAEQVEQAERARREKPPSKTDQPSESND